MSASLLDRKVDPPASSALAYRGCVWGSHVSFMAGSIWGEDGEAGIAILRMSAQELSEYARKCVEELFGGDWYRYTDAYYDQVALLPERTGCDWIGHFDLVTKFNERAPAFDEESPRYLRRALEVMEHLVRSGTAFEVNTGAMAGDTGPLPI